MIGQYFVVPSSTLKTAGTGANPLQEAMQKAKDFSSRYHTPATVVYVVAETNLKVDIRELTCGGSGDTCV